MHAMEGRKRFNDTDLGSIRKRPNNAKAWLKRKLRGEKLQGFDAGKIVFYLNNVHIRFVKSAWHVQHVNIDFGLIRRTEV